MADERIVSMHTRDKYLGLAVIHPVVAADQLRGFSAGDGLL